MTEPAGKKKASNLPGGRQGKNLLLQYAAIGSQISAGLVITVFVGKWIDEKLKFSFPFLILALPVAFLISMTLKVIRDTSKKRNE